MHYNNKSESYGNIKKAFEEESAGHVRYIILSENARSSGNMDLARLYSQLADEELGHARVWFNETGYGDDNEELQNSISEEGAEATKTYPSYAARAELEGYEALSDRFIANGKVEANHRDMLMRYQNETKNGTRYTAQEDSLWNCTVCGHRHMGTIPPQECPLCGYNRTAYTKSNV